MGTRMVQDLAELIAIAKASCPGLPLCLIGHSMGTVLAQTFAANHGSQLAGLVLSGPTARPPKLTNWALQFGLALGSCLRGAASPASNAHKAVFGKFNEKMPQPTRTEFDWLSRDESEVDKYIKDPACGFTCSIKLWKDVMAALDTLSSSGGHAGLPSSLPMLVMYGEKDPVGEMMGNQAHAQIQTELSTAEKQAPKVICYSEARHEVFNETNRAEVFRDLLTWIDEQVGPRPPQPQAADEREHAECC